MKPLLIVVALCGFALPQTAQAPKLKEYPTLTGSNVIFSSIDDRVIEYGNSSALAGDPQMMVPTMLDKAMHRREVGCEKGYDLWYLGPSLETVIARGDRENRILLVCVKPSFIAQLKRAEQ